MLVQKVLPTFINFVIILQIVKVQLTDSFLDLVALGLVLSFVSSRACVGIRVITSFCDPWLHVEAN